MDSSNFPKIVMYVLKFIRKVYCLRELLYRLFLIQYDCKQMLPFTKPCIVKYVFDGRGIVSDCFIVWNYDVHLTELFNIIDKLHEQGLVELVDDDYGRTIIVATSKLLNLDANIDQRILDFVRIRIMKYMKYDYTRLRKLILFKFLNVRKLSLVPKYDVVDFETYIELEKYNGYKYEDFVRERGMKLKVIDLRQLFQ